MAMLFESSHIPISLGFLHSHTRDLLSLAQMEYATLQKITSQAYLESYDIGDTAYEISPLAAIPLQLGHLQEKYGYTEAQLTSKLEDAMVATIRLEDVPEINEKYGKAAGTERILLEYKSIIDSSKRERDSDLPPYEVLIARLEKGNHLLAIFVPIRNANLDSSDINIKIDAARIANLARLPQTSPLHQVRESLKAAHNYEIHNLKKLWLPADIQRKGDILKSIAEQASDPTYRELIHINAADAILMSLLNRHLTPSLHEISTINLRKKNILDVIQAIGLPTILELVATISDDSQTQLSSAIALKMVEELLLVPEHSRRIPVLKPRYFKELLNNHQHIIMISSMAKTDNILVNHKRIGEIISKVSKVVQSDQRSRSTQGSFEQTCITQIGDSIYIACDAMTKSLLLKRFENKPYVITSIENQEQDYPKNLVILDKLRSKHANETEARQGSLDNPNSMIKIFYDFFRSLSFRS